MIDWKNVSLLGIDVGFSERAKTTGIAAYRFRQEVRLQCVGSQAAHRAAALSDGMRYDAIAIDGPVVPNPASLAPRHCEQVLARGAFGKRCKAGFSHFGTGLQLRHAATTIAAEMPMHRRTPTAPVVEAFPNAFLGVLLDNDDYDAMGKIERGGKSDVFYKRVAANKTFEKLLDYLDWRDDALLATLYLNASLTTRAAHDKRAALVCLLTAGCALSGNVEHVGEAVGGHICLPPRELWAPWAQDALP